VQPAADQLHFTSHQFTSNPCIIHHMKESAIIHHMKESAIDKYNPAKQKPNTPRPHLVSDRESWRTMSQPAVPVEG